MFNCVSTESPPSIVEIFYKLNNMKIELTLEQQLLVQETSDSHLVLAPPGTGKTEILSSRVNYALENGIKAEDMLCLTFTNRAAKEMRQRISLILSNENIFVGNLHSFCINFLKSEHVINNSTLLLDEDERSNLINEAVPEAIESTAKSIEKFLSDKFGEINSKSDFNHYSEIQAKYELQNFNSIKKDLIDEGFGISKYLVETHITFHKYITIYNLENSLCVSPEPLFWHTPKDDEVLKQFKYNYGSLYIKQLSKVYERNKQQVNGLDYDDLIALTYNHLKDIIEIKKYSWLQIDEVQDLNPLQWAIIENVVLPSANKVYFGDYEQAIYSFLGAKIEKLRQLEPICKIHNFTTNFRSPSYLLEVYNAYAIALLNPIWKKIPKSSDNILPDKISKIIREIEGYEEDEFDYIIHKILPNLPSNEIKAILVKKNLSADIFGDKLSDLNIPHFKISGFDIFKSKPIKLTLAIMNVIINQVDRSSFIRIFYELSNLKTLKQSRDFIMDSFNLGLFPLDYINRDNYHLEKFYEKLNTKRIVIFDTETTGLNTETDDIIQIACIEIIKGKIGRTFEIYIDTDKDITESQKVHHISKEILLEKGILRKEAFNKFLKFVNGDILVAHNLKYDYEICISNLEKEGLSFNDDILFYDSILLTKRIYPDLPTYKLEYLLNRLDIMGENTHNALDDVKATANLILHLFENPTSLLEKRGQFLIKNKTTIDKFTEKFGSFYLSLLERKNSIICLSSIFNETAKFTFLPLPNDISKISDFMDTLSNDNTLENLLEKHISEFSTYKESDLITGKEKIIISTIHKAKGLGFDNVIITACNRNTFPHPYSKNREEEARLFYVGLSRAKKRILLTSYTKIKKLWFEKIKVEDERGQTHVKSVERYFINTELSPFINPIKKYFNYKRV